MSIANARNGSAIKPRAIQKTMSQAPAYRPTQALSQDQGAFLVQIPDLDSEAVPKVPERRASGRIISQTLSISLIFGAGLGLVFGAILPFVFGKANRPVPAVTELPKWFSNGSSTASAGDTSQTTPPAWPSSASTVVAASPRTVPAVLVPQSPQVGDTRPMALSDPAWLLSPRSTAAAPPAATPSAAPDNASHPPVAATYASDNHGDYRGLDRDPRPASGYPGAPDSRNLQTDNRNDAAAQYRNSDIRSDYHGNPVDTAPNRRDVPASGYPRDPRYDYVRYTDPPAAGQGSPLMPSSAQGPASNYRDSQISEPGVARFDGMIATPPVRASYERTGSSNN